MKAFKFFVASSVLLSSLSTVNSAYAFGVNLSSEAKFGDSTYFLFDAPSSWIEANNLATNLGGHLVTITSQEENDFITNTFMQGIYGAWLGGFDSDFEGLGNSFEWVTGETFIYSNWNAVGDSVEPNSPTGESYLNIWGDQARAFEIAGTWNDFPNDPNTAYSSDINIFGIVEFEDTNAVPEPLTILGTLAAAGAGVIMKRKTSNMA